MRTIRKVSNVVCIALIAGYSALLGAMWGSLPDQVPTHFDAAGQVNGYGSKMTLIFLPVVSVVACATVALAERFPQLWNVPVTVTAANRDRVYFITLIMLSSFKVFMTMLFTVIGIKSIFPKFPGWPMIAVAVLLFGSIITGIVMLVKTCR